MAQETFQFDREKFKDVIHFVCTRCETAELGRVKLHKILYFADMLHFLSAGRPLTGCEYQKQQFGPTAKHLNWAIGQLRSEGRVRCERRDFFGFAKDDFVSMREPDSKRLSSDEHALLNEVIDFVCARTAREISELSHSAAWEMVKFGEVIPYFSALFLAPSETTEEDVAWAEATVKELGLAS